MFSADVFLPPSSITASALPHMSSALPGSWSGLVSAQPDRVSHLGFSVEGRLSKNSSLWAHSRSGAGRPPQPRPPRRPPRRGAARPGRGRGGGPPPHSPTPSPAPQRSYPGFPETVLVLLPQVLPLVTRSTVISSQENKVTCLTTVGKPLSSYYVTSCFILSTSSIPIPSVYA